MKTIQFIFNGEFGWEVIHWQAYCRKLARQYDKAYFMTTNKGSAPLYEDFAEEGFVRTDRTDAWVKDRLIPFDQQEFIGFGEKQGFHFDILIHARNSRVVHKNYPPKLWNGLVGMLEGNSVASVGTEADHIDGTVDLRGTDLTWSMSLMASAKCIIGPSSGPMHLASLCGCPQVVWGDGRTYRGQTLRDRYEKSWNPFGTQVEFIETDLSWRPNHKEIYERVRRFL